MTQLKNFLKGLFKETMYLERINSRRCLFDGENKTQTIIDNKEKIQNK